MTASTIRFSTFPRTEPSPGFVEDVVGVFRKHEQEIATEANEKGLKSDEVLAVLGLNLAEIGFQVEACATHLIHEGWVSRHASG